MLGTAPRGSLQAFSDCLPGAWCAGVGGTEGVLGKCDGISQAAHSRTVCVGMHVCMHVCVCPCGHC